MLFTLLGLAFVRILVGSEEDKEGTADEDMDETTELLRDFNADCDLVVEG
jgi:hypothetical protein